MKIIEIIQTESGVPLVDKDDGFVVYGCIMKGDGQGGLIGNGGELERVKGLEASAYTNFEFFDALCLDPEVFFQYYKRKVPSSRSIGG